MGQDLDDLFGRSKPDFDPTTPQGREAWKAVTRVAVWGQPVCLFWLGQLDSRRLQRRESSVGCGRLSAQPDPSGAGRPGPPALRAEHLFGDGDLFRAGGLVGGAREGPAAE